MEKIEIFMELVQSKIEELLIERGFEDIELLYKDKDGKNDLIFVYNTTEIEFNKKHKVSTHVNIENYKDDMDFSKIEIYGYIISSGGPIFEETGDIIKNSYLEIISKIEKEKIFNSLKDINTISKNKKRI